jgi:phenylpyruvate tautomerase PptA (4-oxalocrotonate tautomerase family)
LPYLQLDLNGPYPPEVKQQLAQQLCTTYAQMMQADIRRISVAIRELGPGGVWRMLDGALTPTAVLMCDIRRGRSPEQRLALARQLVRDCARILALREEHVNVEFTQHAGDEMYHPGLGGFSPEWSPEET